MQVWGVNVASVTGSTARIFGSSGGFLGTYLTGAKLREG
jgi:hypothetical protein